MKRTMNIDEIIDGLQKAIDELREERERIARLEEKVRSLIAITNLWFDEHGHEIPEVDIHE